METEFKGIPPLGIISQEKKKIVMCSSEYS